MTPSEWFYAKGEKHFGPVSANELRRLAGTGEILPDDLIWREGMAGWTIARNVGGLFDKASAQANAGAAGHAPEGPPKIVDPVSVPSAAPGGAFSPVAPKVEEAGRPSKHVFDLFLDFVRVQFPASFIESTGKLFVTAGKYGLFAAMGLIVLVSLLMIWKDESFPVKFISEEAVSLVLLVVLQYVAGRFCESLERLNRAAIANISSTAFLDCVALFSMAAGTALLVGTLIVAIPFKWYELIFFGLAIFVVCQYLAFIALNPGSINIKIVPESRASEEALGLIAFVVKSLARVAPVAFGAFTVVGCVSLLYACIAIFTGSGPLLAGPVALVSTQMLVYAASLPFIFYVAFLLISLLLDLLRAILSLPGKNGEEKKENGEK
jgi:hypothetical protein